MIKFIFIMLFTFSLSAHHPDHKVEAELPHPSIWISDYEDNEDGHNLKIHLENFTFTPAEIMYSSRPSEGYAVVFVNDIPIGRAYSEWFHVPQRFFNLDENIVKVILKTSKHEEIVINKKKISKEIIISK